MLWTRGILLNGQGTSWCLFGKGILNRRLVYPKYLTTNQQTVSADQTIPTKGIKAEADWFILYKLPSIRYLRFVSRFKIYQIMFMSALCCPIYFQYAEGLISKQMFYAAVGGSFGTSIVFLVFSYFTTKVIGELAVNPNENLVKISRLTFNGRRAKDIYDLDDVIPFSDNYDSSDLEKNLFHKMYIEDRKGSEHCYLFSKRLGVYKNDLFDRYFGIY